MKNDNVTTSSQDYLEAILLISEKNGIVRSVDVANLMQVSRAGVNKALGVLKEKGFIRQEKYGTVFLTEEGIRVANSVILRHKTLRDFLTSVLAVHPETAEQDACRMEHAISLETLERLEEFMKKQIKL
jgi:DtxR family transcriptional regulator, Mn-dependent transcriptional regulator